MWVLVLKSSPIFLYLSSRYFAIQILNNYVAALAFISQMVRIPFYLTGLSEIQQII